jgi:hypothetical protein
MVPKAVVQDDTDEERNAKTQVQEGKVARIVKELDERRLELLASYKDDSAALRIHFLSEIMLRGRLVQYSQPLL